MHMWSVLLDKPQINIRMKRQSELFLRNHLLTPKQLQSLLELRHSESLQRKEKYWKWQEMLLEKLRRP